MSPHAFAVHFPVALLIASGISLTVYQFTRRDIFREMFFWSLLLAVVGLGAAILTGSFQVDDTLSAGPFRDLFEVHQNLGYTIASLFYGLFLWHLVRRKKMALSEQWLYWGIYLCSLVLMVYTAHLGGTMVYQHGAGVQPMKEQLRKETARPQQDSSIQIWNTH